MKLALTSLAATSRNAGAKAVHDCHNYCRAYRGVIFGECNSRVACGSVGTNGGVARIIDRLR